jgi:hypothetical protein
MGRFEVSESDKLTLKALLEMRDRLRETAIKQVNCIKCGTELIFYVVGEGLTDWPKSVPAICIECDVDNSNQMC